MKKFVILVVTGFASISQAAPSPKALSTEEIVKTVTQRPIVLQGANSKGSLGSDAFILKTAKGTVIRANLRANAPQIPAGGASSNPEAFHVNMNLSNSVGTTQTMQLKFTGRTKETPAHTRILTYEAPMNSAYAGKGRLQAIVGQTLGADQVWTTKSTYVRFVSK